MSSSRTSIELFFKSAAQRAAHKRLLARISPSSIKLLARLEKDARTIGTAAEPNEHLIIALLTFCRRHVPHYRDLIQLSTTSLADIPILAKETLQTNFVRLIARTEGDGRIFGSDLLVRQTTGSTGRPTAHLRSAKREDWFDLIQFQSLWNQYSLPKHGEIFDFGLRWYRQPILETRIGPGVFTSWNFRGLRITEPLFMAEYMALSKAGQPRVLLGHPSRLVEFAHFAAQHKIRKSPSIVISTYEHMQEETRRELEQAFNCPAISLYGASEVGIVGWECSSQQLHWNPLIHIVEVVDNFGRECMPGQVGRLIVTPLRGLTMPLLRYDTGDLARAPMSQSCECGNKQPFIAKIEGRQTALIITTDNRTFPAYRILHFAEDLSLSDLQLVQRRRGQMCLLVAAHARLDPVKYRRFVDQVNEYLGEPTEVLVDATTEFIRTSSGKKNPFVSVLANGVSR